MNWIILILFLFLGTSAYAGLRAAPWFPTWSRDLDRFFKLADIKPGQKFYDLGCGDGKIVFAAAKTGAQAVGFEISLLPYLIAKTRSFFVKNAEIEFRDFWNADISNADIVYLFLVAQSNTQVQNFEVLNPQVEQGGVAIIRINNQQLLPACISAFSKVFQPNR